MNEICGNDSKSVSPDKICLKNHLNNKTYTDTLFKKSEKSMKCNSQVCMKAHMFNNLYAEERCIEQKIKEASDFIDQYYDSLNKLNSEEHEKRKNEIIKLLNETNYYELTKEELSFGAKTSWRNSTRCIARSFWSTLELWDARNVKTTKEMFEILCKFLKKATNNGQPKSIVVIFPQRKGKDNDFRIWNKQLINYACYQVENDLIIGDKAQLEFTKACQLLGWKGGSGTEFDVLPLVLQANGQKPDLYELPKELIMEVSLTHPEFDIKDLNMKWFVPVTVSTFMLDIGGCQFTAAPFSGFYTVPEICRAMCDVDRYNKIEIIADYMKLDKTDPLWRDRVIIEMNSAIIYSFEQSGKYIMDHHTISEKFKSFFESEHKLRGGCPSDWVWINSQLSCNLTETFYMEMANYKLKPCTEYQIGLMDKIKEITQKNKSKFNNFLMLFRVITENFWSFVRLA